MEEVKLRLEEFKTLYRHWRRGVVWWDHLLLGVLVWMEDLVIQYRVDKEVDKAVEEYHQQMSLVEEDFVTPVYTEKPSEASVSLPEMRLTAPWYKEGGKD